MSDHDAPPIYEYNDEVINDEFFLDESNMLHELSMDDEVCLMKVMLFPILRNF